MTSLQRIRSEAKKLDLSFVRQNATINGAYLYNFIDSSGNVAGRNWTISSAIDEIQFGDLRQMLV
jgi:hypothetical protein